MATKKKSKPRARRPAPKRPAKRPAKRTAARATAGALRVGSVMPSYTVNDLQRSIAWYCEGLGFVVSDRWEHGGKLLGVILKAGGSEFALSQDDFAKGRDRQKGIGCRIHATTTNRVDALAERIRAYGGRVIMEPTDTSWGTRSFAVEDPDGFKISFDEKR